LATGPAARGAPGRFLLYSSGAENEEKAMSRTSTAGITVSHDGGRTIDKAYHGMRIFVRLGRVSQRQAERRLRTEIRRVEDELQRNARLRPRFSDGATRYLAESRDKRTLKVIRWHVRMLNAHIGDFDINQVHDATLESFVASRLAAGVGATTINRSLEVVRTVLNHAARAYRDKEGRPWLETLPPYITMLPTSPRPPFPLTWEEQDRLFPLLPAHLGRMVLFAVNTGLRDSNVCGLQWQWQVEVPEVGRSVFVIPPEAFKTKRPHVVILNDAAWSIVQTQRSQHPIWVFPYRGKRIARMNNTAWKRAREKAGLRAARIHDLRHTFASRLRAAGVTAEDRQTLLGHANSSMAGHYASADIGRLIQQANLVLERTATRTLLRVASGGVVDKKSRNPPAVGVIRLA
jgi:integrase